MNKILPILSITGSDGTGGSGIQADIKTCDVLGGYALTVVSAVTVQDTRGIQSTHAIPTHIIDAQMNSIVRDMPPYAVKIGMICDSETVHCLCRHIKNLNHIVLDTAFISSRGEHISTSQLVQDICTCIMPLCDIVIMKLSEASLLLGKEISNKQAMQNAAKQLIDRFGMKAIIIRGSQKSKDLNFDLAMSASMCQIYTFPDHTNCDTHGLASTLSASIATYLAKRETLAEAIRLAYNYISTLTVYSVNSPLGHQSKLLTHNLSFAGSSNLSCNQSPRQRELYNRFMQLIANHINTQHDVKFYADYLHITPRYLSQITMPVSGKTPKAIIGDAIVHEAAILLSTTTDSIQEIAFHLGFSSQSQFAKLFKREKGFSPTDYRKKKLEP